jgi:ribosomal-protein-serine acetyltransferase
MMFFSHDLGDGASLALRTLDSVEAVHALILNNLDRLRKWEAWAQSDSTIEGLQTYTRMLLDQFANGLSVPAVIIQDGRPVGTASLTIDEYLGAGELGYWIDAAAEGRGLVRRACTALIAYGKERGLERFEIRTAVDNERSCRLAERLGFQREGVLRAALPIGDRRLDVALYALTGSAN